MRGVGWGGEGRSSVLEIVEPGKFRELATITSSFRNLFVIVRWSGGKPPRITDRPRIILA